MLSFECIKNEKSVYFLLTSANSFSRGGFWAANIFSALQLPNLRQISFTTRLFLGIFMAIMSYAAQFPLKLKW